MLGCTGGLRSHGTGGDRRVLIASGSVHGGPWSSHTDDMAWFARFRRRLHNYTSDGDYAGAQGQRSDAKRTKRNGMAQGEVIANRPGRSDIT